MSDYVLVDGVLCHHGILGQKWGVRRFQEEDGTLTSAGKRRYNRGSSAGMPSNVPKNGYKVTNKSSSAGMPSNIPKSGYFMTNRPSSAGMPSNIPKVTNRPSSAGMPSNIPKSGYKPTNKPSSAGMPSELRNKEAKEFYNSAIYYRNMGYDISDVKEHKDDGTAQTELLTFSLMAIDELKRKHEKITANNIRERLKTYFDFNEEQMAYMELERNRNRPFNEVKAEADKMSTYRYDGPFKPNDMPYGMVRLQSLYDEIERGNVKPERMKAIEKEWEETVNRYNLPESVRKIPSK